MTYKKGSLKVVFSTSEQRYSCHEKVVIQNDFLAIKELPTGNSLKLIEPPVVWSLATFEKQKKEDAMFAKYISEIGHRIAVIFGISDQLLGLQETDENTNG